jgi:hypothetical protein
MYSKNAMNRTSFLVRMVRSTGLVATDEAAQYALLAVAILCLAAAAIIFYKSSTTTALSNADIERIMKLQQGVQQTP